VLNSFLQLIIEQNAQLGTIKLDAGKCFFCSHFSLIKEDEKKITEENKKRNIVGVQQINRCSSAHAHKFYMILHLNYIYVKDVHYSIFVVMLSGYLEKRMHIENNIMLFLCFMWVLFLLF
jgi:hypothetical protein